MSVMLTCTRNALRKKSARPSKSAKTNESTSKSQKAAAKPASTSGPHVSAQNVKMWQWVMDDESMTLVFRKDTMEIWLNEDKVDVMDSFSEESDGAVLDFLCRGQKGRITTCRNQQGDLEQVLTINGIIIE